MRIPAIPDAIAWREGMILEPAHFERGDDRSASLSHVAGLVADPWPWGFLSDSMDETALASNELRVSCTGIFPDGTPFRGDSLAQSLEAGQPGAQVEYNILREPDGSDVLLRPSGGAPAESSLPVARLVFNAGVWNGVRDWSPPAILVGPDHPMRVELNRQLGSLAAAAAGFMTTLRMPGAEDRPAARVLGLVAAALAQGVGVMEALLAAPAVAPGRLGIEALRLALGVRSAAGIFEPLGAAWEPADQRGSIRRLLYAAESAASGIGLPFRTAAFRDLDNSGILKVEGMPADTVLLAIEASRPADLIAGRSWFEGAALAGPERIQEALTRRVAGCARQPIERDSRIGVSSGPLLALYYVENDPSWRGGAPTIALAAKTPPPANTYFSILLPENMGGAPAMSPSGPPPRQALPPASPPPALPAPGSGGGSPPGWGGRSA